MAQRGANLWERFRRLQPKAKLVVDSVDLHFLREEAGLALGLSTASEVQANKQQEIKAYQQVDLVIVVTKEERAELVSQAVATDSVVVPIIVPIRAREQKERGPGLLFVGGFNHGPNANGLLWFVHECWSFVRLRVPGVKLTVVGSNPPQEIIDLGKEDGIMVAGFVPETAPYLDSAAVSIAPLLYGAGMKGKVTEAMAVGLPVVTTTFGAQGLDAILGQHLLVADEPSEFAEHIAGLLTDPARAARIGLAGQAHIQQICSAEIVEKQLNSMVTALRADNILSELPVSALAAFGSRIAAVFSFIQICLSKVINPKDTPGHGSALKT